jgi:hypothetical protein
LITLHKEKKNYLCSGFEDASLVADDVEDTDELIDIVSAFSSTGVPMLVVSVGLVELLAGRIISVPLTVATNVSALDDRFVEEV